MSLTPTTTISSTIVRTATVPSTTDAPRPGVRPQPVYKHGLVAAAGAALATTVLAATASAAGVSFADHTGAAIPIAGFTTLTLVFALVGVGLAAILARTARRPRVAFVRTTLALTTLSFVPDLTAGFDAVSATTLIALHTVAAAIVIPTVARRLAERR